MLIILDLNGVLCATAPLRRRLSSDPDRVARNKQVFFRPFLHEFLEFLFARYDVAVWTSCPYFSAYPLVETLFTRDQILALKFIYTRNNCDLTSNYGSRKNLQAVWDMYPQYDRHNTLLLDDDFAKVVQVEQWMSVPKFTPPSRSTPSTPDMTLHELSAQILAATE